MTKGKKFQYTYRVYFTNTDWDKHRVVHFYRQRGDAENVIKEEKEGFAIENILSEDFLLFGNSTISFLS